MEPSLLYLSLLLLTVSAEFLKVDPDHEQFFSGEVLTLSCESWSVKRTITGSTEVQSCGRKKEEFGTVISGSVCRVTGSSPSDSGLYWCESATGDRSPQRPLSVTDTALPVCHSAPCLSQRPLSVTDRNLILDSPALPVAAGSDITLSCRTRTGYGVNPVLVKDGTVVHNGPQWSFTVSKEQEGEYICRDERRGEESEKKRLTVTEHTTAPTAPPIPPSSSFGWVWWQVVRPLLVSSPYGVCTVLLVLVYRGQRRTGSPGLVSMETGQQQQEEEEYENVDAAVTTEHRF